MNLWLQDEPLGYNPGVGERISFALNYKQREGLGGIDTNIFSCGPMWDFSWMSYIVISPLRLFPWYEDPVQMVAAGGGERDYMLQSGSYTGTIPGEPEFYTSTILDAQIDGSGNPTGFTLQYPNGAVDYYDYSVNGTSIYFVGFYADQGSTSYSGPLFFLREKVDLAGHTTQFVYNTNGAGSVFLVQVIDADGRTNTISYTNTNFPTQITSVTDPFGRTCTLSYGTNGVLTNITDVAGISSSFMYTNYTDLTDDDMNGTSFFWVTNLTTPYGTTTFSFTDFGFPNAGYGDGNEINRSVMVVDPMGGTNLYIYQDENSLMTNFTYTVLDVPSGVPQLCEPVYMEFRNSWHWGPLQFSSLSTSDMNSFTTNDYLKGRRRHWMHNSALLYYDYLSDTLEMEQEPSPDGSTVGQQTWYAYPGQDCPESGTNAMPILIAYNLPDGNTNYTWIQRDGLSHPTNVVETYSLGFGTPTLTRSNIYIYGANGIDLVKQIGPMGETVGSYGYDGNHNVLAATNAVGDVTTYTYDVNSRLTSITTPAGLTTTNIYFASGSFITNLVQQRIDIQIQRTNSYSYADNLIFTQTNELGLAITNTWDNLQRLTSTTFPDATYTSNIYVILDIGKTIDRLGNATKNGYDALRHLIAITNALNNVTRYNYCTCGALESMQDMLGNYTHYYYDIAGRLTNIAYPDGSSLTKNYNPLNQVTNTIDGTGISITNWYDDQGILYASSNAFGKVFAKGLDIEDRLTNSVDANGVVINNTYDYLGRLLTRSYPDGGVESFGYSPAGLIAYTNQLGYKTYYGYDAARRKVAETNANMQVTQYGYDAASDLANLTDANSHTTQWGYDIYGRVTNKVDATSTTILTYGYDADNRLTNRWSAQKGNTAYGYDNVGNLTSVTYPTNHALAFSYNAMNWLTSMSDGIGTTSFAYTPVGQLASETGPWGNDTVTYTYSDRLRASLDLQQPNASAWVQSYAYDAANRLQTITSPAGAFGYAYNTGLDGSSSSALVAKITLPNGAFITNTYDNNARMLGTYLYNSGLTNLDSSVYTNNMGNQRISVTRCGENTANYTYDPIGQVVADVASEVSGGVARMNEQLHYGFDPAGNLNFRTNNTLVQNFAVNSDNELTTATNGGSLTVMGTTTSPATNVTVNGSNALLYADATFAATNMPLTANYTAVAQDSYGRQASNTATVSLGTNITFQYDANGNLTSDGLRSFAYDDENQLIQVWVTNQWLSQFTYDGKMRRRIRQEFTWQGAWVRTNAVYYVYDGNLVIQERDINNLPTTTYTRGKDLSGSLQGAGGIGGLLARTAQSYVDAPLAGHSFYHADGNGNVTMLINSEQVVVAKYLYDAFGNVLSASGLLANANLYRFSSKEAHQNSGLVYFLYRYHDPNLQRWPNRDPLGDLGSLGFVSGSFNHNTISTLYAHHIRSLSFESIDGPNLFRFVDNNPEGNYDGDGTTCGKCQSAACAAAAGAACGWTQLLPLPLKVTLGPACAKAVYDYCCGPGGNPIPGPYPTFPPGMPPEL
jgi:RHS repeat-associated protein